MGEFEEKREAVGIIFGGAMVDRGDARKIAAREHQSNLRKRHNQKILFVQYTGHLGANNVDQWVQSLSHNKPLTPLGLYRVVDDIQSDFKQVIKDCFQLLNHIQLSMKER